MEATAAAFMKKHDVPGLSVAIARKGRLVYADGYGLADKDRDEKVTPNHLFRIASVTKPITSATLFSLIEAGKLRLSDKVFGPGAVLGTAYGEPSYQPHIEELTIKHLRSKWRGPLRDERSPHGFARRLAGDTDGSRAVPGSRGRLPDQAGYPETRHPPDHDHGFGGLTRLRQGLVREPVSQLVAYGEPARNDHYHGAHFRPVLLGR